MMLTSKRVQQVEPRLLWGRINQVLLQRRLRFPDTERQGPASVTVIPLLYEHKMRTLQWRLQRTRTVPQIPAGPYRKIHTFVHSVKRRRPSFLDTLERSSRREKRRYKSLSNCQSPLFQQRNNACALMRLWGNFLHNIKVDVLTEGVHGSLTVVRRPTAEMGVNTFLHLFMHHLTPISLHLLTKEMAPIYTYLHLFNRTTGTYL